MQLEHCERELALQLRNPGRWDPQSWRRAMRSPTEGARRGDGTWGAKRKGGHSACTGREAKVKEVGEEEGIRILTERGSMGGLLIWFGIRRHGGALPCHGGRRGARG